jgi:hypothetical protein
MAVCSLSYCESAWPSFESGTESWADAVVCALSPANDCDGSTAEALRKIQIQASGRNLRKRHDALDFAERNGAFLDRPGAERQPATVEGRRLNVHSGKVASRLPRSHLLRLLAGISQRADVHEGAFRQVVGLAVADALEAVDGVLELGGDRTLLEFLRKSPVAG